MVVRLQTAEGETKEYMTTRVESIGENGPCIFLTKCGLAWKKKPKPQDECDHLDCAVDSVKQDVRNSFGLFIACIVLVFLCIHSNTESYTESLFRIYFQILIGILAFWGLIRGFGAVKRLGELNEYRNKGTISGIRAWMYECQHA